jgi:hypothetical protein
MKAKIEAKAISKIQHQFKGVGMIIRPMSLNGQLFDIKWASWYKFNDTINDKLASSSYICSLASAYFGHFVRTTENRSMFNRSL